MLIKKWGGTWWVAHIFGSTIIFGQSMHMQIADARNNVKTEIKCPSIFTYIYCFLLFTTPFYSHILPVFDTKNLLYTVRSKKQFIC